ncbi:glycosyltransferase family 4 protein [Serratia proteamaculans]|uniref:glycosyltransferase family 4 protein n=1 Tax=Serratia proteamaculans TaxID=28151 RepID=UPI00217BF02A|nr:glycosyltransferase family 4 protein [Serratia proteamaculans]CAI1591955.1 Glycosyl transferases group 1 [Serratia proteamaculans]CAI2458592.1 Glycosyl transferases group 1 [Serratia proteamaculans]
MKIMIVNTLYSPYKIGGAEVSVQFLAEEFVAMGHNVRIICLHSEKNKKTDIINGVEVVYLPLKNIYWPYGSNDSHGKIKKLIWHFCDSYNLAMARVFRKELIDFEPDVVHTNNISGFSVSIWNEVKRKKIKLIHTARDYYLFHPSSTLYIKEKNLNPDTFSVYIWSLLKKIQSAKVDVFIGISDFIRDFHVDNSFFKRANCNTIYNSVETDLVSKKTSEHTVIGFIGRLTEDKGFNQFCEIAEKLKGKDNIEFVAAGRFNSGCVGEALDKRARDAGIDILGFIPLISFLEKVDSVVLPIKWREPFGRTVVECAMSEKIVLTNALGGVSELEKLLPNIYRIDESTLNNILRLRPRAFSEDEKAIFNKGVIAKAYINAYKITSNV